MGSYPAFGGKNYNRGNRADKVQNRPGSGLVDNPRATHPSFSLYTPLFSDSPDTKTVPDLAQTISDILTLYKEAQGIPVIHFPGLTARGKDPEKITEDTFRALRQENIIYNQPTAPSSGQWFIRIPMISSKVKQLLQQENITFIPTNWKKKFLEWLYQTGDLPICQPCQCSDAPPIFYHWFTHAALLADHPPISLLVANPDTFFLHLAPLLVLSVTLAKKNPLRDIVLYSRHGRESFGRNPKNSTYDSDALRFGLASQAKPGRVPLSFPIPVDPYQALANKVKQAFNYMRHYLPGDMDITLDPQSLLPADQWMLHQLNTTIQQVSDYLEKCRIDRAARHLQYFFHRQYCNWYLELSRGNRRNPQTQRVFRYSLTQIMAMFQPFLPALSNIILHQLGISSHPLPFPTFNSQLVFPHSFKEMELLKRLITCTRKIRGLYHVPVTKGLGICFTADSPQERKIIEREMETIKRLGFFHQAELADDCNALLRGFRARTDHIQILIYFLDEGDRLLALKQIKQQRDNLSRKISRREKKLNNPPMLKQLTTKTAAGQKKEYQKWIKRKNLLEQTIHDLR